MVKESEGGGKDKGKDAAGLHGLALVEVVMEVIEKADFFPALGQCNASKGIQGLRHQLQARKPSSLQLDVLDNLVSPFLLLAAAEKMYHSGTDMTESCAGPLPMYEEVHSDLGTLLQLFQAQARSAFVSLVQSARIVVDIRLWLCRWYLLHDPFAGSVSAAAADGPEAQAARQDPLSTLTVHIQRLERDKSNWKKQLADPLSWMEVVLVEGKTVAISLQTLALLNRYPPDLLSVSVQLLRMRKAIGQWEDESVINPPACARDVVTGAPHHQILRQQFQHLVNKMPLRFHAVADQVMPLSQYNTELLGLPLPSSSLSSRYSSSDSSSSNPYVALIAQFLFSYGPAAKVCVSIFNQAREEGAGGKEEVNTPTTDKNWTPEQGQAYDLPRVTDPPAAPSQRQDTSDRGFVPTFSMTAGQAAAASSSKQHSTARHLTVSSTSSTLTTESSIGRLSFLSSSYVPGMGITAGSELGGPFTTSSSSLSARRDHDPPTWFWALCHHSGLWFAVEGRLPEGGAKRFSLSGGRRGGGGKGGLSGRSASPLEGTFIHQSGKHHIYTYFVAHVSPQERLVVAFGDRNRPANDKIVTSFLMTATSILNDSIAYGV